ncbi:hypothetical protein LCGC14_0503590 [marine sediment metagenome]|uniref:Uncharacterized protein n=1 Tax=marine sediment metagenome TaxID=412755 RepID=A0A0F9UPZ7_9ZZZZ
MFYNVGICAIVHAQRISTTKIKETWQTEILGIQIPEREPESFNIRGNKIYFSGNFSRWWIKRIFQKFADWIIPTIYKMKYIIKL